MSGSQEHGWVALAGAGPGDEGLLTVRAAELLGQAGLVVAGESLAAELLRSGASDLISGSEGQANSRNDAQ